MRALCYVIFLQYNYYLFCQRELNDDDATVTEVDGHVVVGGGRLYSAVFIEVIHPIPKFFAIGEFQTV